MIEAVERVWEGIWGGNRMGGWVPILNGLIMAMGIQYCSHDKNCNGYQSHTAMAIDGTYAKEEFTYEI